MIPEAFLTLPPMQEAPIKTRPQSFEDALRQALAPKQKGKSSRNNDCPNFEVSRARLALDGEVSSSEESEDEELIKVTNELKKLSILPPSKKMKAEAKPFKTEAQVRFELEELCRRKVRKKSRSSRNSSAELEHSQHTISLIHEPESSRVDTGEKKPKERKNLRALIEKIKLEKSMAEMDVPEEADMKSDDSFYSIASDKNDEELIVDQEINLDEGTPASDEGGNKEGKPVVAMQGPTLFSLSHARDLVASLSKEDFCWEEKMKTIEKLQEHIVTNPNQLEGLVCSNISEDLFRACSYILRANDHAKRPFRDVLRKQKDWRQDCLQLFLEFFGDILAAAFGRKQKTSSLRAHARLRCQANDNLMHRIFTLMCDAYNNTVENSSGFDLLKPVSRVVYWLLDKKFVIEYFVNHRLTTVLEALYRTKKKNPMMCARKMLRYLYEWKHDLPSCCNDQMRDLTYCDWFIEGIKKSPVTEIEDPLLGLYFIMNRMPSKNVEAVFKANKLETVLDKVIASAEKMTDVDSGDIVVVAKNIKHFNQGNYLKDKIERNTVLGPEASKEIERRRANGHNNNLYSLVKRPMPETSRPNVPFLRPFKPEPVTKSIAELR